MLPEGQLELRGVPFDPGIQGATHCAIGGATFATTPTNTTANAATATILTVVRVHRPQRGRRGRGDQGSVCLAGTTDERGGPIYKKRMFMKIKTVPEVRLEGRTCAVCWGDVDWMAESMLQIPSNAGESGSSREWRARELAMDGVSPFSALRVSGGEVGPSLE